jgi:methylmalonyl-CoA mutase N-terminal domain/subunit
VFDDNTLEESRRGKAEWQEQVKKANNDPASGKSFKTISNHEIKPLYTPEDTKDLDFARDIGYPGGYPYTRGCQPTGYRGRIWTFRMFSGFGTARDTNQRWHQLLKDGETGLSTAFDFPTLMGYDTDSPRATAECGKCGVAIDTLADMETLTEGIPLDKVTTSMTINPPASILWAMYLVAAEKQGVSLEKAGGTIQNDPLKEFIAQKTFMPTGTIYTACQRYGGVRHEVCPPLEHHQHQRVSHS